MSGCICTEGPRCEYHYCGERADYSALVPASWMPPLRLRAKFFCKACWEYFAEGWSEPLKGITRPPNAPEDWQPSLSEHIRHGQIAIAFENRHAEAAKAAAQQSLSMPFDDRRYTASQLEQIKIWRQGLRDLRKAAKSGAQP